MENLKLPIALVIAMGAQLGAAVWWVSGQAAIISDLEGTVAQMSSRMAIEKQVNLGRDVELNASDIEELWDELDEVWDEHGQLAMTIMQITKLQQRVAVLEAEFRYLGRDHENLLDQKGGMH